MTDHQPGYSPLADEILSKLDACQTEAEIDQVAKEHADDVRKMAADKDLKPRSLHIRNLAALKRREIRGGRNVSS